MKSVEVALRFVEKINAGDVEAIAAMMTPDHRFVDSLGREIVGREKMKAAWTEFYRVIPDYILKIDHTLSDGPLVALFGTASGTYAPHDVFLDENKWAGPAAWRARIDGAFVAEWQLYVDLEPLRKRIRRESNE